MGSVGSGVEPGDSKNGAASCLQGGPTRSKLNVNLEHEASARSARSTRTIPPLPRPSSLATLLQLATLQINVRESANMQHATVSCSVFCSYSFSLCLLLCRNICKYSKLCADLFTDSRALGMAMPGSRSRSRGLSGSGGYGVGGGALL